MNSGSCRRRAASASGLIAISRLWPLFVCGGGNPVTLSTCSTCSVLLPVEVESTIVEPHPLGRLGPNLSSLWQAFVLLKLRESKRPAPYGAGQPDQLGQAV